MNFLRRHWYDLGGVLSLFVVAYLLTSYPHLTRYQLIVWVNLVTLLLHQMEEYRIPGTFPGMVNKVLFKSTHPDRYPLNSNTAFYVNVAVGWTSYLLAALLAERALWLGMATTLVSLGNVIAHTFLFNIKGKTFYNAGLLTVCLLFAPCTYLYFATIHTAHLVTKTDYLVGIPLGIVINYAGILKMIDWMADKETPCIFEQRNLLPEDRALQQQ